MAKTVALNDIADITAFRPGPASGRLWIWGTGAPGGWYALDWRRSARVLLFGAHRHRQRIDPVFSARRLAALKVMLSEPALLSV